jgi:hypothetical protein
MEATNLRDAKPWPAATAQRRAKATSSGGWKHHSMNANPHTPDLTLPGQTKPTRSCLPNLCNCSKFGQSELLLHSITC